MDTDIDINRDTAFRIQAIRRVAEVMCMLDDDACLWEDGELSQAEALEKERMLMHERERIFSYLGCRFATQREAEEKVEEYKGHPEYEEPSIWKESPCPWLDKGALIGVLIDKSEQHGRKVVPHS
tara:strand:- start:185 stop:559 length:375 start_codon:yes stop_codon:yes gene_type:complete